MNRWIWIPIGLALVIAARPAGAQATAGSDAPKDIVSFPADDYELVDAADTGTVTIRITLAENADIHSLHVEVKEVADEDARKLAGAFKYEANSAKALEANSAATIKLTVDFLRVNRPIAYKVTLGFSEKPSPDTPSPDTPPPKKPPQFKAVTHTFKLTHPAAKARVIPEKLVIERVGWLPVHGEWDIPALELEETTGLSRITPTGLDLRVTRAGEEPVKARLKLTAPPAIAMGSRDAVGVEIEGRVPGGTVTGKAELHAPQMSDPVAFPYEIRSRVHCWTVLLTLLAGLVIGFVTKWAGHKLLQRVRLRREVAEIVKQAVDARRSPDAILITKLTAVEHTCLVALGAEPEPLPPDSTTWTAPPKRLSLDKVRDGQRKALDDAVADWAARVAEQKTQVAAFTKAVGTPWLMPPEFRTWLEALQMAADRARTAIERGDAVSAEATIENAFQGKDAAEKSGQDAKQPEDPKQIIDRWRAKITALATQLTTKPAAGDSPWPEAAATLAPQIAARLQDLLNAVDRIPPTNPTALATWLASVHAVQAHLEDSAVQMESTWAIVVAAAQQELTGASPDPLARIADQLPRRGADATAYLEAITSHGTTVVTAFRKALLDSVSSAPDDEQRAIKALIDQGKWSRAAAETKLSLPTRQGPAMDSTRQPSSATEPVAAPAAGSGALPAAAWPAIAIPVDVVDVVLQRTIRAERNTVALTTVLSILTLAVLYLVHYMPQSIGTWPELLAVLAQALTLDVGIDAVTQAVKILIK